MRPYSFFIYILFSLVMRQIICNFATNLRRLKIKHEVQLFNFTPMKTKTERFFMTMLLCLMALAASSQTTVVDKDENFPVAYASVFNQDGKFLGQTDVDGLLPDIQDAKSIRITHIAYEPLMAKTGKMGATLKMKPVQMSLNDAVIAKPRSFCIRLTGFLRNFSLSNQLFEDDDPILHFYEGTGQLYIFLDSKKSSKWVDLATRDSRTGEMVDEQKHVTLHLSSNSVIEGIRKSKKYTTREAEGFTQIIKNDTTVGTIMTDTANHILRTDIDYLFPDTARTINLLLMKIRVTSAKDSYIYRQPEDDYCSQSNLLAHQSYMRCWTKAFGKRIEGDSFDELYIDLAEFLTEEEYKEATKQYKADKKSGAYSLTSEQLDEYISSHNIPQIPEELQKSLEISREIQAKKAEKKAEKKKKKE